MADITEIINNPLNAVYSNNIFTQFNLGQYVAICPPIQTQAYGVSGYFYNITVNGRGYDLNVKVEVTRDILAGWEELHNTNGTDVSQLYIPAVVGLMYAVTIEFGDSTEIYSWTCRSLSAGQISDNQTPAVDIDYYLGIFPEVKPSVFLGFFGAHTVNDNEIDKTYLNIDLPNPTIHIEGVSVNINTVSETR